MGNIFGFYFLAFTGLFLCTYVSPQDEEVIPDNYLQRDFPHMNRDCSYADKSTPCMDIRICSAAAVSLALGGYPVLCGWVSKGVPKVCCGLPLVLGKDLMGKMDEENAAKRRCGTRNVGLPPSRTEELYLQLLDRMMPFIDTGTPDPDMFDPPLAETVNGPPSWDPPSWDPPSWDPPSWDPPSWTPMEPDLPEEPISTDIRKGPARQGDFPWMVSIKRGDNHICTGTVIDRSHILTAAHCFTTSRSIPKPRDYVVHIGNINVEEGLPFSIRKIDLYPQYKPPLWYHSLAILTLDEVLSPQVVPICLPSPEMSARDLTGEDTTLLGWGQTEYGGTPVPSLYVNNLTVVPFQECKNVYGRILANQLPQGFTEDFICAGIKEDGGSDPCQSEYGGPLMYTSDPGADDISWIQVGILSFGANNLGRTRCEQPGFPGVYVKVANYLDWITEIINES